MAPATRLMKRVWWATARRILREAVRRERPGDAGARYRAGGAREDQQERGQERSSPEASPRGRPTSTTSRTATKPSLSALTVEEAAPRPLRIWLSNSLPTGGRDGSLLVAGRWCGLALPRPATARLEVESLKKVGPEGRTPGLLALYLT